MLQLVDIENLQKTRRSLMLASTATLVFATLKILSNELSFFGIKVEISQVKIVLLCQIGTIYLLFVFVFQVLPEAIKAFDRLWGKSIDRHEQLLWRGHENEWGPNQSDHREGEYLSPPDEDATEIRSRLANMRAKKASRIERFAQVSVLVGNFFISYASPLGLALVCLLWPNVLKYVIG